MKEWKDLTDKEIQIEIAMNLSKIANILEMAFQPEIRHYAVLKQEQEDRAKLLQKYESQTIEIQDLKTNNKDLLEQVERLEKCEQ